MSRFLHTRYAGLETYTPESSPGTSSTSNSTPTSPLSPLPGGSGGPGPGGGGGPAALLRPRGDWVAGEAGGAVRRDAGPGLSVQWVGRHFELRVHGLWEKGAVFPSLTYSFYPVFANLHQVPYETVPPPGGLFPWMWRGCRERESSRCWPTPTRPRVWHSPGSGGGPCGLQSRTCGGGGRGVCGLRRRVRRGAAGSV